MGIACCICFLVFAIKLLQAKAPPAKEIKEED